MITTLVILGITAVLFVIGKIRSDIVALCALIALLVSGILTPAEGLSGFSNPIVIMMAGLFIVGGGVFKTGLAKKLSSKLLSLAGGNETKLFLLVMLGTSAIGAFVSNTGTVALMLPIIVSMAASNPNISASRLLMPLAFASSIGGMLTLIGTPPNLIIDETLQENGFEKLEFFSFLPIGLICVAVGTLVLLPLSKLLIKKQDEDEKTQHQKGLTQLMREYQIIDDLVKVVIPKTSSLVGKTIGEVNIRKTYSLNILEIRHEYKHQKILKDVEQNIATAKTQFQENDIVYLSGKNSDAANFASDFGLTLSFGDNAIAFYDIGLAEVLLLQRSKYVGQKLKETNFREKFGISVLAIRRNSEYIKDNLQELKLQAGDVMLVQGSWEKIGKLPTSEDYWIVLGQPLDEAQKVTLDYKAPLAACIMLAMVAMMVFDFIPIAPVTAVLIAAVLMILTGCFKSVAAAYKTINWESIVLIAAMLPMSVALEKTGASDMISQAIVNGVGATQPMLVLAAIYLTTSVLTMFISNTATAVLMAPIALTSAESIGVSPYPMLFAVAVAASMCFASPFSTPSQTH